MLLEASYGLLVLSVSTCITDKTDRILVYACVHSRHRLWKKPPSQPGSSFLGSTHDLPNFYSFFYYTLSSLFSISLADNIWTCGLSHWQNIQVIHHFQRTVSFSVGKRYFSLSNPYLQSCSQIYITFKEGNSTTQFYRQESKRTQANKRKSQAPVWICCLRQHVCQRDL